jgi:hypothetical protein
MNKWVCNYAVVRFMPYPETEEFVCIGIALLCQTTRFFGYKLEMKRRDRVTGFFPELDVAVLTQGRRVFEQQLQHVHRLLGNVDNQGQMTLAWNEVDPVAVFKELVRPRESLFRFSGIATVLTDNPAAEVDRLYQHYVNRQFAQRDEYQELVMARRLTGLFKRNAVLEYRTELLGDDTYKFRVPFVKGELVNPGSFRAIKPLNLTQNDTTRILDHGDLWLKRARRLLEMNVVPDRLLIPVKTAAEAKRADVAYDVCNQFRELGVTLVEFGRQDAILEFAKAG